MLFTSSMSTLDLPHLCIPVGQHIQLSIITLHISVGIKDAVEFSVKMFDALYLYAFLGDGENLRSEIF